MADSCERKRTLGCSCQLSPLSTCAMEIACIQPSAESLGLMNSPSSLVAVQQKSSLAKKLPSCLASSEDATRTQNSLFGIRNLRKPRELSQPNQLDMVGERGFEPPTPWSRSNDRNDSLGLVLRFGTRFYPVFGSDWTQFGPKF